jgi:hypothetical protein
MKNIEVSYEGTTMVLRVDLTQEQGLSSSGKNMIIASSAGNKAMRAPGMDYDVVVGVNIYKPV